MNDQQKNLAVTFARHAVFLSPENAGFRYGLVARDEQGKAMIAELIDSNPNLTVSERGGLMDTTVYSKEAGVIAFATVQMQEMAMVLIACRHGRQDAVRPYSL